MGQFVRCARAHYWAYERGLRKITVALPLRFGSAWARALEAIYRGADYTGALAAAIPAGVDLDAVECAKVAGLLRGYLAHWRSDELHKKYLLLPERKFERCCRPGWMAAGVIDLLAGRLDAMEAVIIESKTSGGSIAPDSDFWLRLRFNVQVLQYVEALAAEGVHIDRVIYDVTKKPCIKPLKAMPVVDTDGLRIVNGPDGKRAYKKDGSPRLTGGKGFVALTRAETPEEYAKRLEEDCLERPDFYFARREVPVLKCDLDRFKRHRWEFISLVEHLRRQEHMQENPADAWLCNVSETVCRSCQFKDPCLAGITPAEGYSVQPFNPELERQHDDTDTTTEEE